METGKKKEVVKKKEKKKKPKKATKATNEEQPSPLEKAIPPVTSPQESEKDKQEIIQEQPKSEKTEEVTKKPKKKVCRQFYACLTLPPTSVPSNTSTYQHQYLLIPLCTKISTYQH